MTRKRQEAVVKTFARRLYFRHQESYFLHWLDNVYELKRRRFLLKQMFHVLHKQNLSSGFAKWKALTEKISQQEMLDRVRMLERKLLEEQQVRERTQSDLLLERHTSQQRRRQLSELQLVHVDHKVMQMEIDCQRRAFVQWRDDVRRMVLDRTLLAEHLERRRVKTLRKLLRVWRFNATEQMHHRLLLTMFTKSAKGRAITRAFRQWHVYAKRREHFKRKLQRCFKGWKDRNMR